MSNIDIATKGIAAGGRSMEEHTQEPKVGTRKHTTVDVSEEVVYSKILPHTPEAGDPYYIGDAYNDNLHPICQEWETDMYVAKDSP
jgi:hypothetical protein